MSNGKKFSSRASRILEMHMPAMSSKPANPARPGPADAGAVAKAVFGPATHYRFGVLMPVGPAKRERG